MDDAAREEIKKQIVQAKADVEIKKASLLNDMELVYEDPMKATRRITDFVGKNGEKALIDKLREDPAWFGGTKGHVGSKTFLKMEGFSERKLAKEFSQLLPEKAKSLQIAENHLKDLQRAYHGDAKELTFGASKDKDGPER